MSFDLLDERHRVREQIDMAMHVNECNGPRCLIHNDLVDRNAEVPGDLVHTRIVYPQQTPQLVVGF